VLKQYAADIAPERIAMIAYRHSRSREWIFGGITKEILKQPPAMPVHVRH
jgi:hypothetical protein